MDGENIKTVGSNILAEQLQGSTSRGLCMEYKIHKVHTDERSNNRIYLRGLPLTGPEASYQVLIQFESAMQEQEYAKSRMPFEDAMLSNTLYPTIQTKCRSSA
jgi:hypothetical protein